MSFTIFSETNIKKMANNGINTIVLLFQLYHQYLTDSNRKRIALN